MQPDFADIENMTIWVGGIPYDVAQLARDAHFYQVTRRRDGANFGAFHIEHSGLAFACAGTVLEGSAPDVRESDVVHMANLWAGAMTNRGDEPIAGEGYPEVP